MCHLFRRYVPTIILILFLGMGLVFTSSPAMGQVDIKPGVKAGLNFADLGGDDADAFAEFISSSSGSVDIGRRTGFAVGGFALIDFAGPFALQPELVYVQKGQKSDLEAEFFGETISGSVTTKLDYIEVPLLAKFQIPVAGPLSPNLFAGPTVGFTASSEVEMEFSGESESDDIGDDISGTDFGLAFGGGADFGLSAATLTVDLRYGLGLTDIPDEGEASVTNQGIMLTAGLAF